MILESTVKMEFKEKVGLVKEFRVLIRMNLAVVVAMVALLAAKTDPAVAEVLLWVQEGSGWEIVVFRAIPAFHLRVQHPTFSSVALEVKVAPTKMEVVQEGEEMAEGLF